MLIRRRQRRAAAGAIALVLLAGGVLALAGLTALDSADASSPVPPTAAMRSALAEAGQLGSAAGAASLGLTSAYDNPPPNDDLDEPGTVISSGPDQPDPFMVVSGGRYYLFASQDHLLLNIPVTSGSTIGHWGPLTDALPTLPSWVKPGWVWAPDIRRFGSHYILYFTGRLAGVLPATMCIGDAYSTNLAGPYLAAPTPFICQMGEGGSIDPRTFVDPDGTTYLIWKSDNNSRSLTPTSIFSQALSPDGEALLGQPTRIFGPDEPWQGTIVEAPQLVLVRGSYYLFYSGNWFNQADYAIGVARCAGPSGPCADTSSVPLLASNDQGWGPGEESVFSDAAGIFLLYNPFCSTLPRPGPPRPVSMVRLGFGPDGPYLATPEPGPTDS